MAKSSTKSRGGSTLKKLRANLKDVGLLTRPLNKGSKKKISTAESRLEKLKKINDRVNPFELKFNREKHDVLNRSRKGTVGKPTESRLKGHETRKKTILTEFKNKHRVGAFRDKRFGETDPNMTPEDRMLERFALEKRSRAERSAVYNLEDNEEELTHFGQSLSGIENIDEHDPRLDEEDATRDRDYTRDLHFGGPENADDNRKRSYKEIMQEVIAKSKFHKMERQKLKEETESLRQDLNEDFDEIRNLLFNAKEEEKVASIATDKAEKASKSFDDYDVFVKQLVHEKRAKPTDRLKTEDEVAREEAEKLVQLEKKRKRGMMGPDEGKSNRPTSGDALGDLDYYKDSSLDSDEENSESEEEEEALVYKDGKLVNGHKLFMKPKASGDSSEEEDQDSEEESGEEEETASEIEETLGSDVGESAVESEQELPFSESDISEVESEKMKSDNEIEVEEPEELAKEVPFVLTMPKDIDEFKRLILKFDSDNQKVVLDRLLVLHHPSLNAENPDKLRNLLCLVIDFLCGISDDNTEELSGRIAIMYPVIVKLGFQYPEKVSSHMKKRLSQVHDRLKHRIAKRSHKLLEVRDVVLFLLITRLFATSDYRHDIVLSMYLILAEVFCQVSYLLNAFMESKKLASGIKEQICTGLLLSHIYMECQMTSKRYMPELMYFLGKAVTFLSKNASEESESTSVLTFSQMVSAESVDFGTLLHVSCKTVESFADSYLGKEVLQSEKGSSASSMAGVFLSPSTHEGWSWEEIFTPFSNIDSEFSTVNGMKSHLEGIRTEILADRRKRCQRLGVKSARPPLQWQKKIVKNIKTAEPKFESNYNMDRKSKSASSERDEQKKLEYLYKKEMKGAIRELKRDTQFMAAEKLKETRMKDQAYKKMINQIKGSIGNEASDAKSDHKTKKRKTKK